MPSRRASGGSRFGFSDSFLISFRCPERLLKTLRPEQQQFSPYEIEICQGQEAKALGLVLGQSAITNFAMAPEPLDDMEDMFHFRSHLALSPIPLPVVMVERSPAMASALHPPTLSTPFVKLPLPFINIGSVTIDRWLAPREQIRHYLRVVHFGCGHHRAGRQAVDRVRAHVQLHAEKPIRAFASATHLR